MDKDSSYLHLHEFEMVCATTNLQNTSTEQLKLKFFSFSLKDKAKMWIYSIWSNLIERWDELQEKFFNKKISFALD